MRAPGPRDAILGQNEISGIKENKMNTELWIAAITGVLLLVYLTYTVVRPEKF